MKRRHSHSNYRSAKWIIISICMMILLLLTTMLSLLFNRYPILTLPT